MVYINERFNMQDMLEQQTWHHKLFLCICTTAVPREQLWGEGCVLSTGLLAVVSGGASSGTLQDLSSSAVVEWLTAEPHPSPGLLLPLLASASRSILHLNHRNPILQAGLLALFSHGKYLT